MKKQIRLFPILLILVFISLSGCEGQKTPTIQISSTNDARRVVTTEIVTTPTLFVTPTLTASEREKRVLDLISTNGNCELPCFWGIGPGKTKWSDTEEWLIYMGSKTMITPGGIVGTEHATSGFQILSLGLLNSVVFIENQDIISAIGISSEYLSNLSNSEFWKIWNIVAPENLIPRLGVPSRVWLDMAPDYNPGRNNTVNYALWVYFDQSGVLAIYSGLGQRGEIINICPTSENMYSFHLYLRASDEIIPLENIRGGIYGIEKPYIKSISDVTELRNEDFSNLYQNEPGKRCFKTPIDAWRIQYVTDRVRLYQ